MPRDRWTRGTCEQAEVHAETKAAELCVFGCVSAATGWCSEDDRAESAVEDEGREEDISKCGRPGWKEERVATSGVMGWDDVSVEVFVSVHCTQVKFNLRVVVRDVYLPTRMMTVKHFLSTDEKVFNAINWEPVRFGKIQGRQVVLITLSDPRI